ncbi:MAG: nitroreductase family protein [Promethearchaeota archaeon]|jgi:nitroreductase
MKEFIEVIKERRSIRNFKESVPTEEQILRMIEAAGYAPSATNLQPWKFLIIRDEKTKRNMVKAILKKVNSVIEKTGDIPATRLSEFCRNFIFFENAPIVIIPLYKPYPSSVYSIMIHDKEEVAINTRHLGIMCASAATQNLLLAAHSLGLGGCWMDGPLCARKELKKLLRVNEPWEILALVPIGVPASIPKAPRRKNVKFIAKFIDKSLVEKKQ